MLNPENEIHSFVKGSQVEVSSDEEGFKGAYFEATILECPPKYKKRKKALVIYRTLLTDDGRSPLTECIDLVYMRPLPPAEDSARENFEENDIVDARYRDGWWLGVVRKVFDDSSYMVYFDNPPDVIHFQKENLRTHLDWVNGKWVLPEKQLKD
ncbi:DUF724 domain-containing protein 3-like isoform X2 [Carica papaya]|uniref:DUF724 domain-containing protein 3-like isoform X2 n=1 Tax=Carica papaya TaxID=3649 RepID=UPI000B8C91C5|nr:DUF724 domain-containing protein 3-like isoform X2 [Carica papaya]